MLNAVEHLYRSSNQFRLRAVEVLYLCGRGLCRWNKAQIHQKMRPLLFLSILGFCLTGGGQSIGCAQSMVVAKPDSRRIEAKTLKQGIVQRRPGEPDTSFLKRVLPVSYPSAYNSLVVNYAWRPTPFGKQLFFSRTNGADNEYDLFLFMLDPFQADTYAVQCFDMGNMGDLTIVAALFFADVDQDGQKELLALSECDLKEIVKGDGGERLFAHVPHYETHVFQYAGLGSDGRPQYREDKTPRSYLAELPTAVAVRQAIARHQKRAAQLKPKVKASK